jgi:hypothetical protein
MTRGLIWFLLIHLPLTGCGEAQTGDMTTENAYEIQQTETVIGISVKSFAKPQGLSGFDDIPEGSPKLLFSLAQKKPTGGEPREWYHRRASIFAKGPDGSEYEAYCGHGHDKHIISGHNFLANLENRRHLYLNKFNYAYYPKDVFIGKPVKGQLKPNLFFRDVGSHTSSPHHFAVDSNGLCHLVVADIFSHANNPLKLYWLIGNPGNGKWKQAWLVHYRPEFTSWATPWTLAWRRDVHLIWNWASKKGKGALCYLQWTPKGFGRKTRLYKSSGGNIDVAIDPKWGRIVVIFSNRKGVFICSRSPSGVWTKPSYLKPELTKEHTVSIHALDRGRFLIRICYKNVKEFILQTQAQ